MKIIFRILLCYGAFVWTVSFVAVLSEHQYEDSLALLGIAGLFAVIYFCAKLVIRFYRRREEAELEQTSPGVSSEVKSTVLTESILIAILLERLESEQFLKAKELPPNIEITTRRVHLEWLSKVCIRDCLEPWLNDVLLAPDGYWTPDQMDRVAMIWEYFEAMRWVMGFGALRPLAQRPKFGGMYALPLVDVKDPSKLRFLPPWEVRPARDEADAFNLRCWYELVARGEMKEATVDDMREALEVRDTVVKNCYQNEYQVGSSYLPFVPSATIAVHMNSAARRGQALALLVEVLGGDAPTSSLRAFLRE